MKHKLIAASVCSAAFVASAQTGLAQAPAAQPAANAGAQAAATEAAMTPAERTLMTHGFMALPGFVKGPFPADAVVGAGYIPGVPRLNVPSLRETDASLGVSYVGGLRKDGGATPLPSGVAMASTWNPELIQRGGAVIGAEAKAKGFNIMLAGGVNLMRDPRNGRTFEYLSEDPLLSGVLGGAAIAGIQSNHMISTVKHFALNGQETGRHFIDSRIGEAAARESDLLAFQIAIERGRPGAVMCAYNKVNGAQSCDNDWLLNRVLKHDWAYQGFVMSDWGAVPSLDSALHGLDQQSGEQLDPAVFFGDQLAASAAKDAAWAARLKDMNRRILNSVYANGLDRDPPVKKPLDKAAGDAATEAAARQGIVLLRNVGDVLPLTAKARKIAVIGGFSANGVLSGGGSSQVQADGGPALTIPTSPAGPLAGFSDETFHRSVPLDAIAAKAAGAEVTYRNGRYLSEAVAAAKSADVAIVFATQWSTEGFDLPDLTLPDGQDALIAAVAKANPHTIVVLETGSAVLMPWLGDTAAVLEAWYPGGRGAQAIASVLFGETNPSGRLPISFPASIEQLPRPKMDGADSVEPNMLGKGAEGQTLSANYDIEGADVGYRWYARQNLKPLFPFGFGLSYTQFRYDDLKLTPTGATVTITNTGQRAGADVAQLYLVSGPNGPARRLAGFQKVDLQPGEKRSVQIAIEPRILAAWRDGFWTLAGGRYRLAIGADALDLGPAAEVTLAARRWK
jgi:beta-glucosidase